MQKQFLIPLLLLTGFSSPGADTARFVQDRFAIGMWVPPAASENLDARYREIAAANFSLVIGMSGTNLQQHLKRCQRFGLKTIPPAGQPIARLPDGPACWGYLLADEPSPGAFADLARRAQEIRATHPGRFGYVNL